MEELHEAHVTIDGNELNDITPTTGCCFLYRYLYYPILYFSHLFSSVVYDRNPLLYMVFGLVNLGIGFLAGYRDLVILN